MFHHERGRDMLGPYFSRVFFFVTHFALVTPQTLFSEGTGPASLRPASVLLRQNRRLPMS
mgnify:CR=1 FL=1